MAEIAEHERVALNVRASEERYRSLHESMMDAYVKVDMTGRIVEFNHVYSTMLGYSADERGETA